MYERSTTFSTRGSSYSSPSSSAYGSSASSRYGSSSSYSVTSSLGGLGVSASSRYGMYDSSRYASSTARRYNPLEYESYTERKEREERERKRREEAPQSDSGDQASPSSSSVTVGSNKKAKVQASVNGSVIRIRRKRNESSSSEEEESEDEVPEEAARAKTPTPPPKTPTPPPPPPEDPLDVEERSLNSQLCLSLTLTMTDEENIRQRLLEIKKTRIKRSQAGVERELLEKFEREAEAFYEPTKAKEEDEKVLLQRLSSEPLREVETKDLQVRLQELFRERKVALEETQTNMVEHYQNRLQETSGEISTLDTSISDKRAQIEQLQEDIVTLTVRKELLSSGMDKITNRHGEQLEQIGCQKTEIEERISQYAVSAPAMKVTRQTSSQLADDELKELEQELECPVCMDISRPPIYQCEEGHIICSSCKPLLTNCPSCSTLYSNPVIRCRFAEKLSERYFKFVERFQEELCQED